MKDSMKSFSDSSQRRLAVCGGQPRFANRDRPAAQPGHLLTGEARRAVCPELLFVPSHDIVQRRFLGGRVCQELRVAAHAGRTRPICPGAGRRIPPACISQRIAEDLVSAKCS